MNQYLGSHTSQKWSPHASGVYIPHSSRPVSGAVVGVLDKPQGAGSRGFEVSVGQRSEGRVSLNNSAVALITE